MAPLQPAAIDTIPPEVRIGPTAAQPAVSDTAVAPEQTAAPKAAVSKSAPVGAAAAGGGFWPLALGGLAAGVIGFGVATLTTPATDDTLSRQVAQQSAALNALEQRVMQAGQADLDGIRAQQDDLVSDIATLSASLSDLATRLDTLESRPAATQSDDPAVSAAVTADIDALRAQLAEMTDAARTELEAARAAAAAIEQNAAAAARNAAARAALARVQTALESGAPIGAALADLEDALGRSAPADLIAVQDGVPTLPALQQDFPDAARAALATARREGVAGEDSSGLGAFLRNQFDVRATAPRAGNDADAVLSRAEAALRGGRLSDALAEISALPEVARAEMSDWLAQAEARASAVAAVDMLSTSLTDN